MAYRRSDNAAKVGDGGFINLKSPVPRQRRAGYPVRFLRINRDHDGVQEVPRAALRDELGAGHTRNAD